MAIERANNPYRIVVTTATPTRWHRLTAAALLLLVGLAVTACGFSLPGQPPAATEQPLSIATYVPGELTPVATAADITGAGNVTAPSTTDESPTPTNLPAEITGSAPLSTVFGRYNGEIEPEETVNIAAEVSGPIVKVLVDVGDVVQAGQVLVEIDGALLAGQQAQAVAGLKAAQAQLDQLLADADPEELEAARAAVNAAATAYGELTDGPRSEDLQIAEANLRQSAAAVQRAQNAYNQVKWRNDIGALPQSEALHVATLAHEAAQAQYEKIVEGATADVIAGAYAQLVQARTQLTNLQNGADLERIVAAEAQVEQAEATLYLASVQLAKTTIRAPMDGIVMSKHAAAGAIAAPGTPLLTLMSQSMNVIIPVEELQLATVAVGQPGIIRLNAFPDQPIDGTVLRVAPLLNAATRTVEVTIRPVADQATVLRPGMFATVELLNTDQNSATAPAGAAAASLAVRP